MINLRPVIYALGPLVFLLGISMVLPAMADLWVGSPDWGQFLFFGGLVAAIGLQMFLANRDTSDSLNLRQAFLLTSLAWIILPAAAALPLWASELGISYTDAYFEAMSGLTTTGSTILTGLDDAPPGILLWRGLLQWLGGIGIIVMAVAVLPMLRIGGMQLFRTESFNTADNIIPRARQLSFAITGAYIGFTALCALLLMMAGMPTFDAIIHGMTTIATGGFSTSDGSIGSFDSAAIDAIVILFMIIGSIPFVLYLQVLRGRTLAIWRDEQVRVFLFTLSILCFCVIVWLVIWKGFNWFDAARYGSFNIISIMTGTGFATTDYGAWGSFSASLFFFVMLIGGCAGSTSCGIKIFRFMVLFKSMKSWMSRMVQPNGIFIARYNRNPISEGVVSSVMSFFVLFLFSLITLAIALTLTGLDWITALSGASTALANVGPGLGDIIGPASTFEAVPDSAKWLLSAGMLLGRLELFTILVMITPGFWRD